MRINVTGNAGAGKSTLAQHIASTLDLPLVGIDNILWKPGWNRVSSEELEERLAPLLEEESWVVDGVSRLVRDKADYIVFLDVPRRVCAWRCIKRNWRYLFRSRPGLPAGCPEWRVIPTLARMIRDFPRNVRPAILMKTVKMGDAGIVIRDPVDKNVIEDFIQSMRHMPNAVQTKLKDG